MACAATVSIAVGLPLGSAGTASRGPQTTYLLRGTVVQYIAPAGSMIGSLSVRVTRAGGAGAKRLNGELVTVAIQSGDASTASQLLGLTLGSSCKLTLKAQSPASILKGGGALRNLVAARPVSAPPQNTQTTDDKNGGGGGAQAGTPPDDTPSDGNEHGDDGSHGNGHGDPGSGSSGHGSGHDK